MYRGPQCTEPVVDHQAPALASYAPLSPCHYFAEPKASNCQDLVRSLSYQDNCTETSEFRGDVPPKKASGPLLPGGDDSEHLNESTVGSQGYHTGSIADYSSHSYRSKIATFSSGISEAYTKPGLQRSSFKGGADEADNKPQNVDNCFEPSLESPAAVYRNQVSCIGPNQLKPHLQVTTKPNKVTKPDEKLFDRRVADAYRKTTYAVLIGDTVRVCNTKVYASLPLCNKCMVKERIKDAFGNTRVKMSLKVLHSRLVK